LAKKISILVIISSFIVIALVSCMSSSNDEPRKEHSTSGASVMSEQFVLEKLKSPGSAKFASIFDQKIDDLGEGRYKVTSYVDSQNGFGALVRTNYVCTLKYVGNDKWQLENLDIKQ